MSNLLPAIEMLSTNQKNWVNAVFTTAFCVIGTSNHLASVVQKQRRPITLWKLQAKNVFIAMLQCMPLYISNRGIAISEM